MGDWETFIGRKDRCCQVTVEETRNDRSNFLALDYQTGEFAQTFLSSIPVRGAIRPIKQLQMTASMQVADFGARSEQAILGMNYDLGATSRSAVGWFGAETTGTLISRSEGAATSGTEYFLIFGDPNATRFKSTLVLKVSMPFEIKG